MMQAASSLSLRWMLGEGSLEGFLADSEVNGGGRGRTAVLGLELIRGFLGVGCFRWGRRGGGVGCRGLLGWVCPKRRGLKPRWRGCLQETMRWAGVFGVFSVCFRCAFGVALHGVRADLLRFGHLARSLRRAGTRVRAAPERAGLGRGARGRGPCRGRGVAPLMRFRGRSRGPGPSSSGMKPALRAAAFVDGTPATSGLRYRGAPGSTNRASRPRLLRTVQHLPAKHAQPAETQESP